VSTLDSVQTPLTMETRDGKTFVVIHEANLVDYARMNIRGPRMDSRTLHADLAPYADGVKVAWPCAVRHALAHDPDRRQGDRAVAVGHWLEPQPAQRHPQHRLDQAMKYVGIWWACTSTR